ncbi:hypothetical protein KDK77_08870, partial [bacterium]|nr:hypothetical protein [bacterium]
LGRGDDFELLETEWWTDGIVVERDNDSQDIRLIRRLEHDGSGNLLNETIVYQHHQKSLSSVLLDWPAFGWRAVYTQVFGGNDTVLIVDELNNTRGLMEVANASFTNPANVVSSVVFEFDNSGIRYGYVDTNKDGLHDGAETTLYSIFQTWSVDATKEAERIINASGDTIIITDAKADGKVRAEMTLVAGSGLDFNNPANVASSIVYVYDRDGSWEIFTDVNKNGVYDAGTDTTTGVVDSPDYRTHDGALTQLLDNEGNVLSNTFGSGDLVDFILANDGTLTGTRQSEHNGTVTFFDNDGLRTHVTSFDGNTSLYNPGALFSHTELIQYDVNGNYVGVINHRDTSGNLLSQTDNEGNVIYFATGTNNASFNITDNGYSVTRFDDDGNGFADAQIQSNGDYRVFHANGLPSIEVVKQGIFGGFPEALVTEWDNSGFFVSQTSEGGGILELDQYGGQLNQFTEVTGNALGYLYGADSFLYATFIPVTETDIVLQNGVGSLSISNQGTTPTNAFDITNIYKWTEDSGATTVYRWKGINRYFVTATGVLTETRWIDGAGTLERTIVYGADTGSAVYEIASITDADGSSFTVNRTGGVIDDYTISVAGNASSITMDTTGQISQVVDHGHTSNFNASGNLTSLTTADGLTLTFTSVATDTVVSGSDGRSQVIDMNGNVTSSTDSDGTIASYTYVSGNIFSVSITEGGTGTNRLYELFNGNLRLSQTTETTGRLTEYFYENDGQLDKYIVTDNGVKYEYEFMFFNNGSEIIHGSYLTSITKPGEFVMTYTRDFLYPYRVLSRTLELIVTIGSNTRSVYLEFYASDRVVGTNDFDEGDLEELHGSGFGNEFAIKNP